MSSLLQFSGQTSEKGVRLEFILVTRRRRWKDTDFEMTKTNCPHCSKPHEVIYTAWRKPVGMWGCWVVFRYLGGEHVPDLSIPIEVDEIPRGAVRLSDEETFEVWHRS